MMMLTGGRRGLVEANAVLPPVCAKFLPQSVVSLVTSGAEKIDVKLDVLDASRLELKSLSSKRVGTGLASVVEGLFLLLSEGRPLHPLPAWLA